MAWARAVHDHPHLLDFKYRLKWYILGKNSSAIFTNNKNTEETSETFLLQPFKAIDSPSDHNEIC